MGKASKIKKEDAGLVKVPIKLSDKEIQDKGKMAALLRKERDEKCVELAEIKKKYKAMIGDLERRMYQELQDIDEGVEAREVHCEWHFDFDKNKKRLVRVDNDKVVEEQDLDEEERQMLIEEMEGAES